VTLTELDDGLTGIEVTFCEQKYMLRPEQMLAYLVKSIDSVISAREPRACRYVMTASPTWNDKQRRIVAAAFKVAGKPCLAIVNSTTAAAVAYAMMHRDKLLFKNPVPVLFLDFGSSSLTAAVAQIKAGKVEMLSVVVDTRLGGSEFTSLLVQYLLSKVKQNYKTDPTASPRAMIRFRRAAEKVKKTLSINRVVSFEVQSLPGDVDVSFLVKREEFVTQIQELVDKIAQSIEQSLELANVKREDLRGVEILGGGSRIPAIRENVAAIVGKQPTQTLNADECCGTGAAHIAALMSPGIFRVPLVVRDILTIPVSARWSGQQETVFDRFSVLPASTGLTIKASDGAEVAVFSGEEEVGRLKIETGSEEEIDVLIQFRVSLSSIVEIKSVVGGEDKHQLNYTVEWLGDVTEENVREMIDVEGALAEADRAAELIDEAKNSLDSALFALEGELRDSSDFFSPREKENAEQLLDEIRAWFDENDFGMLPIEEYQTRLEQLRAWVDRITRRRRTRANLLEQAEILKKRLDSIEQALQDDQLHSSDREWHMIRDQVSQIANSLSTYESRDKFDDSPFDIRELTHSTEDASSRQAQLKTQLLDPVKNELFDCIPSNDWEDEHSQSHWLSSPLRDPANRARAGTSRHWGSSWNNPYF
jgi:molecular chaperone DnaK (HSP70)